MGLYFTKVEIKINCLLSLLK